MRVGLFDEGSLLSLPNLAVLKLAGYWRRQGAEVLHNRLGDFDRAYISCIFSHNWRKMKSLPQCIQAKEVFLGGTGYDLATEQPPPWEELPPEIEHAEPDYSLAPDWPFSLGFSYRGCIRNCPFCVVPRKEGKLRRAIGSYRDLLRPEARADPRGHHVVDMANNILAAPEAELAALFQEIRDLGVTVDFNQGLDHRLVTEGVAEELATLPLYHYTQKGSGGWRRVRRLYLALDWGSERAMAQFERASRTLFRAGIKPSWCMVYVLERPGEETDALKRVRLVVRLGMKPYVMPLDGYRDTGLARWVNRGYHRFVPWAKYWGKREGTRNDTAMLVGVRP